MKIFLICPVRNASEEQKEKLMQYIVDLEKQGHEVYYPARDTDQNDNIGYRICTDNKKAIRKSHIVHLFWDKNSQGSLFDLGMAFALGKSLKIVNLETLEITPVKSFANMVKKWAEV